MNTSKPAGVILAGGRSSRMAVAHKALVSLHGGSLISHVINRFKPQLGLLLLSTESTGEEFSGFDLPVVPDLMPRHRGPLTGLCSALQYLADARLSCGLILCPCDAPFVPLDLGQRLLAAAGADPSPVVVCSYGGVLQPTFSLWQTHHLAFIHEAVVNQGQGGLKHMFNDLPHTVVEWAPAEPPPFFNVNTIDELNTAAAWLDRPPASQDD